ncbi:MAG: ABC transporter ATP-binding protein [Alphaproteobacteria bacterium]|nr:ABC transporter ATP-binding protein [Alphaproteobacteria bacterium]
MMQEFYQNNQPAINQPVIEIRSLKKHIPPHLGISIDQFSVNKGEMVALLGPNGSGKTTFLRMLCGLVKVDSGTGICLGSNIITDSQKIKASIGYMTQKFSLYDDLTVGENIRFISDLYECRYSRKELDRYLDEFSLLHRKNQLTKHLSGGWKQRLSLAACLSHHPQILLLDEPTAGVDLEARHEFLARVQSLTDKGITVILITHYLDELRYCNRIVYLNDGKIGIDQDIRPFIDQDIWSVHPHDRDNCVAVLGQDKRIKGIVPAAASLFFAAHPADHQRIVMDHKDLGIFSEVPCGLEGFLGKVLLDHKGRNGG